MTVTKSGFPTEEHGRGAQNVFTRFERAIQARK